MVGKSFGSEYINELIQTISKEKITQLYFHKYDQYNPDENKGEAEHRILNHIKKSISKSGEFLSINHEIRIRSIQNNICIIFTYFFLAKQILEAHINTGTIPRAISIYFIVISEASKSCPK